ncbi:MAG: hypothetical protein IT289_01720 [Oligoflexia bacterium]|nr:hypothetical protein [Oligoflexia bacterium]
MKFIVLITAALFVGACSSNPHKAEKVETDMERSDTVSGDTKVGVKDGNLVVQKKTMMNEELRDLQHDVFGLEDRVYGNRKYGSTGLYGALKDCKAKLSDKSNGGDGKLIWTEPIDRVTDKEEDYKIGIDEKDKLVAVSEEFLKDRIKRFREYKRILQKRQDEYEEKVDICKTELKSRQHDKSTAEGAKP